VVGLPTDEKANEQTTMTTTHASVTSVLLTAVAGEANLLIQSLAEVRTQLYGHIQLTFGTLYGHPVAIGCCGIGKASAAAAAAAILNNVTTKRLIMLGCAGAYPPSGLKVGDLAVATQEILADDGVAIADGFLDLEQLKFSVATSATGQPLYHRFPCDGDWLLEAKNLLPRYAAEQKISCLFGAFATVSCCSGTRVAGQRLYQRTQAITENMEGAAVALVCAQYTTPFAEIRAISNMVENRDMTRWNLPDAMHRAQHSVLYLLQQEIFN
jgi:futalosine hydrolase